MTPVFITGEWANALSYYIVVRWKPSSKKKFLINDTCKNMNIQDADIMLIEKRPTRES